MGEPQHTAATNPVAALRALLDASPKPRLPMWLARGVDRHSRRAKFHLSEGCSNSRKDTVLVYGRDLEHAYKLCKRCARPARWPRELADTAANLFIAMAAERIFETYKPSSWNSWTNTADTVERHLAAAGQWWRMYNQGPHPLEAAVRTAIPIDDTAPAQVNAGDPLAELASHWIAACSYKPDPQRLEVLAGGGRGYHHHSSFAQSLRRLVEKRGDPIQGVESIAEAIEPPSQPQFELLPDRFVTSRDDHPSTAAWMHHEYQLHRRATISAIRDEFISYRDQLTVTWGKPRLWYAELWGSSRAAFDSTLEKHPNNVIVAAVEGSNRLLIVASTIEMAGIMLTLQADYTTVREMNEAMLENNAFLRQGTGIHLFPGWHKVDDDEPQRVDDRVVETLVESAGARQIAVSLWVNDGMELTVAGEAAALAVTAAV